MKNTLVVVADLACLKAYRIDDRPEFSSPRLELVDEFQCNEAHTHLLEKVSDMSGRFPMGSAPAGSSAAMSAGERHNILLEQRRRLIRQLAERLNFLVAQPGVERCFLAASREIHHQLVEALEARARDKIRKTVAADLTKVDKSELLRHFET